MITEANDDGYPAPPLVTRERRSGLGGKAVWRLAAAGLALFLGGAVAGGSAVVLYVKRATLAESPSPERIGNMLVASLTREFTFTPDESAGVRACVGRRVAAMEESSRAYGENVRAQFGGLCGEICAILGPERSRKWKDVMRRQFGENASVYIHMTECNADHGADCACLASEDAVP